jgi:hypothetical protein
MSAFVIGRFVALSRRALGLRASVAHQAKRLVSVWRCPFWAN